MTDLWEASGCLVDPDDVQVEAVGILRGLNVHPYFNWGACLLNSPAWHGALHQRFEAIACLHSYAGQAAAILQHQHWYLQAMLLQLMIADMVSVDVGIAIVIDCSFQLQLMSTGLDT